jgi:hypothetical protein
MHYDEDDVEYSTLGEVRACDHTDGRNEKDRIDLRCVCEKYIEGEYEPEVYDDE